MKTPLIDGQRILFSTIDKNLKHRDYDRVTKIAEDFSIYATGIGVGSKLARFNPRETEEQFAQRLLLTKPTTQDMFQSCLGPINKVGKTPAKEAFEFKNKESKDTQSKELAESASNFYGKKSVKSYLVERMPQMDSTDPNGFIVIEFYPINESSNKYQGYPFEVNSKEAINYFYKNNTLQWLIVQNDATMLNREGKLQPASKYTIYLSNESIVATQVHKELIEDYKAANSIEQILKEDNYLAYPTELKPDKKYILECSNDRYFVLELFEHKIGFVPANRVGSVSDIATRNRTCVPLIMPAQPYFEKAIKAVSEFDLSTCLHLFPQKIQYTDACDGEVTKEGRNPCHGGINAMGETCHACNGSGMKVHKSSMDLIQLRLPKNPEDMMNLENLLVYKYPPIDLLKFQEDLALHKYRYMANKAVYNSEVFASEGTNTATEKLVDLEAVYDTLAPYAENWSEMYVFIMEALAALLSIDVKVFHAFPKDFKMVTYQQLLEQYKIANENNAPSYIKKALTRDLSNKLYVDQPEELHKIAVKEKFYPFPGKTDQDIMAIITNDMTTDENKVLQNHFDYIFNEIEFEQRQKEIDFYLLNEVAQKKLIDDKVAELIEEINGGASNELAIPGLDTESGANINTPNDVEAEAKAKLKGSVGGVQGILEIQASVAQGITDYSAAISLLYEIFGFDEKTAKSILGTPKKQVAETPSPIV